MKIDALDHFTIRTAQLLPTRDFFVEVLGLVDGERPDFDFPGAWLYQGDKPVVHLIGVTPDNNKGLLDYLGKGREAALSGSGAVDHLAFRATGLRETQNRLKEKNVPFFERTVPGLELHQVFIEDPNGVTIELNFPASEARQD